MYIHSLELTWLRGEWLRKDHDIHYKQVVVHVTMLVPGRVVLWTVSDISKPA